MNTGGVVVQRANVELCPAAGGEGANRTVVDVQEDVTVKVTEFCVCDRSAVAAILNLVDSKRQSVVETLHFCRFYEISFNDS